MERFGRLNIVIGIDAQYCVECGSPELEDGCTNSGCWRARPNARLPISLVMQQMAIRKSFPSGERAEGLMHRCLHFLRRPQYSHGSFRPWHAGKPA
jgi:hypothetical protein